MPEDKARDPYFDNLRGILICLVCAGHCFNLYREDNIYCNYLFHLIYAFHMPLFFYISGYFSKNTEKTFRNAFKALIVPTIPFELLYFIMHVVTKADNTKPFLTPIFAYWFCFALFFCRVLLPYLSGIRAVVVVSFAVALAAGFNPYIDEYMSLSRFLCMLPFFMMGYFTSADRMNKIRGLNKALSTVVGIAAAVAVILVLRYAGGDLGFTLRSPYEDVTGLGFRAFQFAICIPLSLMVVGLTPNSKSYLSVIGRRTLQIYFLHFYAVTLIKMFNPFEGQHVLNSVLMIAAALLIALVLSCNSVNKVYNVIVGATDKLIMK